MTERITSAFGAFTPAREVVKGLDLSDRTAIVTGGATGIGIETARALAEAGAKIVIAVRKPDLAEAAVASINETASGPKAGWSMLDLSSFESIRAFASRWGDKPLHILINNAAVMACPLDYTQNDLEMQIGTNHFGHFLLTTLLAPAMEKAAKAGRTARVVSLSSIGHRRAGVNFEDPNYRHRAYDKWESYGQAKSANALFAVGFHKRFAGRGVTANAVMPGGIMTPLQRHLPMEEQIALGWVDADGKVRDGFKTTEQGASTSVWAATAPALEGIGGLYLEDCAQATPWTKDIPWAGVMPHALDPEGAEKLWALSEKTVAA